MEVQTPRILYTTCPLCGGARLGRVGETDCTDHPRWRPELGATIAWRCCTDCGHVFSAGWLPAELRALLDAAELEAPSIAELEAARRDAARVVSTLTSIRGGPGGRWLDVGAGAGALVPTAEEFGYDAVGLDARRQAVELLREHGYEARCTELEELDEPRAFDVVSLVDRLPCVPHPRTALRHVHRLLRPEGLVFVSAPCMDSLTWKALDRRGANPWWAEIGHLHHFGRERMYALLRDAGFEPCHYAVGEHASASMEIVAVKLDPTAAAVARADALLARDPQSAA